MTEPQAIEIVNGMSKIDKLSTYMNYFVNMLAYRHNFEIIPTESQNWMRGWPEPKIVRHGIAIFPIAFNNKGINTFEQFIDESNAEIRNHGDNWQEEKFAAKEVIIIHPGSICHYVLHGIK